MEHSPELNSSVEARIPSAESFELQRLSKLLEESKQEAYELRSRLQIAERCALDLEGELEANQQEALEREKLHKAALREIQEEKLSVLKDAEDRNANLEAEYQSLYNKFIELEKELQAKADREKLLKLHQNEQDLLQQELKEALDALTAATEACEQHKELILVLQNEKQLVSERLTHVEEDLQLHKEYLNVSKDQLQDLTQQLKEAHEQLALAQSELSALKSAPADIKARGNSLFAEVEDDRQKILKQYRTIVGKYNSVKGDYSSKCSEITKLKKEVAKLQSKLETVEKEARNHYNAYVGNYEIRIQELQKTISDLKNDVKPIYLNGDTNILKFAEKTVENSRKEVLRLREEMEWRSALRLNEAAELLRTRGELSEARSELRQAYLRTKKLKERLEQQGMAGTLSVDSGGVPVKEEKSPQATISNLIDAIMVPWKQADQKSSEITPNVITVIQEVHQTTARSEPITSGGNDRPFENKLNPLRVVPPSDEKDENIYSNLGHLKEEVMTNKIDSNRLPCAKLEEKLALQEVFDRNREYLTETQGEEVASHEVQVGNDQCATARKENIFSDKSAEMTILRDEMLLTPEEELALGTVRGKSEREELSHRVVLDENERHLTLERGANRRFSTLGAKLTLQLTPDESEVLERDRTRQFSPVEEEVALQTERDVSERRAVPEKSAQQAVYDGNERWTTLDGESALYSELQENRRHLELSAHSPRQDELHLRKKQIENTTYVSRHQVFIRPAGGSMSLEEELAFEANNLCLEEADTGCKTDFPDGSCRVTVERIHIKQEPVEEMSQASDGSFFDSPHAARSAGAGSDCISTSSSANPADGLKHDELSQSTTCFSASRSENPPDRQSVSTPVKIGAATSPETPRSILKNRNRVYFEEESSAKGVHFDDKTNKTETEVVETEKENVAGGSEANGNNAKPKRKFKRPPPKKAYPIYYVTT